jgi:quercetin dioxygenase-like cupin family protein
MVKNIKNIKKIKLEGTNLSNVYKQVAINENDGWNDYVMRIFTLEQGGFTPEHSHPWPHINYVIEGKGTLYLDGVHYTVEDGFVAYIPPNSIHQFKNTEDREFKFICIVPKGYDK